MEILNRLIAQYEIGEYGKGEEALLKKAKEKSIASTQQSLVSAGLAGTTMGAGAGLKWEQEVGMPSRLELERQRKTGLAGALTAKAGYLQTAQTEATQVSQWEEEMEFRESESEAQRKASTFSSLAQAHAARLGAGGGSTAFMESKAGAGGETFSGLSREEYLRKYGVGGTRVGGFDEATGQYRMRADVRTHPVAAEPEYRGVWAVSPTTDKLERIQPGTNLPYQNK